MNRFHAVLLPFYILMLLINFIININVATSHCLGQQQLLLLKINLVFNAAKSTKLAHWNQSEDCCELNGVTCNKGRIIGVDLSEEFITGGLDTSSLFDLQYLQKLNLAYNDFGSSVSPKFGLLKKLRYLNLSNAGFHGQIPNEIAHLTKLATFDLSTSIISSPVPKFLANLSSLTTLQLSNCSLTGVFPTEIFLLRKLKVLDVSDNQNLGGFLPNFPQDNSSYLQTLNLSYTNFSGQLPGAITNLKRLSTLDLSNCQFNGTILPLTSFVGLKNLVHLDLSFNYFSGPVPFLNESKNLKYVSLFQNEFTGAITSTNWEGLLNLTIINLGDNSLYGKIPSTLFTLPSLQELTLSHNKFDRPLDEFPNASFSTLNLVDLSNNKIPGPIPMSFFHLTSLGYLYLSSNQFNGTIQIDMLRMLRNLDTLGLSNNKLSIDAKSSNASGISSSPFPSMAALFLGGCNLREFPIFLRNQSRLVALDLSGNQIEGTIPNWIWRFDYMLNLNLSDNFLTSLEGPFENISSIAFMVDLHSNELSGTIPIFSKNAVHLDFSSNRFTLIPPDIRKYINFTHFLSLSNNAFHGKIPQSFCNCLKLRMLDLSHNSFNHSIPECLTSKSDPLRVLNLHGNKLTGSIPDKVSTSSGLRFLNLNGNLLSGTIPTSLAKFKSLQILNLGNNLLSDRFPCFLKKASTLRVLILRSNKLYGPIRCGRSSTNDWEMLHILDLASNNFTGKLPGLLFQSWPAMMGVEARQKSGNLFFDLYDFNHSVRFMDMLATMDKILVRKLAILMATLSMATIENQFSYFVNAYQLQWGGAYLDSVTVVSKGLQMNLVKILAVYTYLDFSSNQFEGPIPQELMNLRALNVLNLSHNAFSSHIPSSLGNLTQLESLDLSSNNLSQEIPPEIASLFFLSVLNLSYNHLVGKIPMGSQIQTFEAASFQGNEGLCGPPLTKNCNVNDGGQGQGLSLPTSPGSKTDSSIDWNFLSVELGFTFGLGCVIFPILFWKRWRLWYSTHVDDLLYRMFPQLDFVYERRGGKNYRILRWVSR